MNDYLQLYIKNKKHKIVELIDSKRIYKIFFLTIKKTAFIFAEIHEFNLYKTTTISMNYNTKFLNTAEKFRHHMRLKKVKKIKTTAFNSIFVFVVIDDTNKFIYKKEKLKLFECICDMKHYYNKCYYFNEKKRFIN